MKQVVVVSPSEFEQVKEILLQMECAGHTADEAAFAACRSIGLNPKAFDEIEFVVKFRFTRGKDEQVRAST